MKILTAISDFFKAEKTEYWHRDRSIEIVASEQDIDINSLKQEMKEIIKHEGRVEAISKLRHRFHVPLSAAWRFIDKLG
jgi:hypothetical protein